MPDIRQLQLALVENLRKSDVLHSQALEEAFLSVPRHLFLPDEPVERAYSDIAIMVKKDEQGRWTSSSSQPAMMAIMLEQLDLQPGMRVLEIGAGTGFNAALMAHLVGPQGRVVSIDIQPDLVEAARQRLDAAGFNWVEVISTDGGYGYPEGGPYDRIILTVASPVITPAWWDQLTEGGRLVMPLEILGAQKSVAFLRRGQAMESVSISDCGFMMLQGDFAPQSQNRVQLGLNSPVYVTGVSSLPMSPHLLNAYLSGPWSDLATGVRATPHELWTGLLPWLSIHHTATLAGLIAEGERAEPSVIPPLIHLGHDKELSVMQTLVAVGDNGAAALVRPPGHAAPLHDLNSPPGSDDSFALPVDLWIRQFGPDPGPWVKMHEFIRAWDAAGRPGTSRLHFRAVPATHEVEAKQGEHRIARPWTTFLVYYD